MRLSTLYSYQLAIHAIMRSLLNKSVAFAPPSLMNVQCPVAVPQRALPRSRQPSVRVRAIAQPVTAQLALPAIVMPGPSQKQVTVVMKFGGSSVRDSERLLEVAQIVCGFPEQLPCVVLSAMGKTTNKLLESGEAALKATGPESIPLIAPLREVMELHRKTAEELGLDEEVRVDIERHLQDLTQLLIGVNMLQELTPRARDALVSFGERLSTRIFAALLNKLGVKARQFDAFKIGVITNDNFTNSEVIYEKSLPAIAASLTRGPGEEPYIPIVTGFLGRGEKTGAITTLGRGGSDLTCTLLGAALGLEEVQVWKDVDGVLTSDPRIVPEAIPVDALTYEEATELAFFGAQVLHPLAMRPAEMSSKLGVRVKNSYNVSAPGTIISKSRQMDDTLLTSIVLKRNVTIMDVISSRMLGQYGFLGKVFEILSRHRVSVDMVATSEVSVSFTLDPSKIWTKDVVDIELTSTIEEFKELAEVTIRNGVSIISLICNVEKSSLILERVFKVLGKKGINVQMISQGASKTNISVIVDSAVAEECVKDIHREFFHHEQ